MLSATCVSVYSQIHLTSGSLLRSKFGEAAYLGKTSNYSTEQTGAVVMVWSFAFRRCFVLISVLRLAILKEAFLCILLSFLPGKFCKFASIMPQ